MILLFFVESPDYDLELKYKDVYVVRQGGVVRLSVPIKGKPQPSCRWSRDGGDISAKAMIASSEDASELVIKGAERSDSGVYDLLLENKVGKKKAQIKVKVIGRPNAPEGPLLFEEIQANSVKVVWKAPTNDGGSEILGYIVERREAARNAWYTVDSRVTDTQVVVKGLREGTEYHFKVTAENSFGVSSSLKSEQPLVPKTPLCKLFTLSALLQLLLLLYKCESIWCHKFIYFHNFHYLTLRPSRTFQHTTRDHGHYQKFCGSGLVQTQRRWWLCYHWLLC